jgi:hypothetical protein
VEQAAARGNRPSTIGRPAADHDQRKPTLTQLAQDAWPERIVSRRRAATAFLRRNAAGAGTGGGC